MICGHVVGLIDAMFNLSKVKCWKLFATGGQRDRECQPRRRNRERACGAFEKAPSVHACFPDGAQGVAHRAIDGNVFRFFVGFVSHEALGGLLRAYNASDEGAMT